MSDVTEGVRTLDPLITSPPALSSLSSHTAPSSHTGFYSEAPAVSEPQTTARSELTESSTAGSSRKKEGKYDLLDGEGAEIEGGQTDKTKTNSRTKRGTATQHLRFV